MSLPVKIGTAMAGALRRVYVVGVGMTNFEKPSEDGRDYPELVHEAVTDALADARISYKDVEQAYVGYVFGDSTSGQRALYDVGLTSIPIVNVNNNCATGSSALFLAQQAVRGGLCRAVIAVGFEKMNKNSLSGTRYTQQANPAERHVTILAERYGIDAAPMTAQLFGAAGKEHMEMYGTTKEHFAKIAWKNHKHSTKNPKSQQREEYSLQEILDSPLMVEPLTRLQCCPVSNGAAAAVVVSEETVSALGLQDRAVEVLAMEMATDPPSSFEENSCIKMVGFDMTRLAAERAFAKTGMSPKDVDVVELHDCFSTNELLTYEALGLCPVGQGASMVDAGDNTYGGKYVVNPSGGLISKGHPLGATGLAQCAELCWQLRGMAQGRQVEGAKIALQHNLGLGGAVVVGLYRRYVAENKHKHVSKL